MEIGMLWFDNDKRTSIPSKVEKAARYYQDKYGVTPDLCYVHPTTFQGEKRGNGSAKTPAGGEPLTIGAIRVLKNEKVLPDHFWIGKGAERLSSDG